MPAKHGYLLPEVINPERVCVQLSIPNERNHLLAFWAQVESLGSALSWDNDDDHTAKDVAEVWKSVYREAHEQNLYYEGCEGMTEPCCDETNDLLKQILQLMNQGFKIVPLMSSTTPPDELADDCAPDHYDSDQGDEGSDIPKRIEVLCFIVESYVTMLLIKSLQQMHVPVPDWSVLFPIFATMPPSFANLVVVYPSPFSLAVLIEAFLTMGDNIDAVTCEMRDNLSTKLNTYDTFRLSVDAISEDEVQLLLSGMVAASNGVIGNWKAFNSALDWGMTHLPEGYECPCPEEVPSYPVLVVLDPINSYDSITSYASVVLTEIDRSTGIWRIQQDTIDPVKERYIFQVKDEFDRVIDMEFTGDALYPTQSTELWWRRESDGSYNAGSGGGHGVLRELGTNRSTPFDTYYKVTLVP